MSFLAPTTSNLHHWHYPSTLAMNDERNEDNEQRGGGDKRRPRRCELHRLDLWYVFYYLFFSFAFAFRRSSTSTNIFFINILATLNMSNGVMYDWEKVATSRCEGIFYVFR